MSPGQLSKQDNNVHPQLISLEKTFHTSSLTQLFSPVLEQKKIELWVKRDDMIHPIISGNKWRKLKYVIDDVLARGDKTIISMGGAYSNHLHALAYVGQLLNIQTIGYIRGEKPKRLSPTLIDVQKWGMELRFVSRSEYRKLREFKHCYQFPNIKKGQYWLPEGGATKLALKGVREIMTEIGQEFDVFCVPCGTGTTFAGIVLSAPQNSMLYGFSALKGAGFLDDDVEVLLGRPVEPIAKWQIQFDYHFGGFAKTTNKLVFFINTFENQYNIELESIYTGKMFCGLFDMINKDTFKPGQKIVAIHTGGLQGNRRR